MERRLLGSATAIIAVTPLSAARLRDWLPAGAGRRVTVIRNGFDEAAECPERVERKGSAGYGEIVLVYTGTLDHRAVIVRDGKGGKDRVVTLPDALRVRIRLRRGRGLYTLIERM